MWMRSLLLSPTDGWRERCVYGSRPVWVVTVAMLASQHPLGLTAASPSLYLTDILCFDDESRTVYNQKKKIWFWDQWETQVFLWEIIAGSPKILVFSSCPPSSAHRPGLERFQTLSVEGKVWWDHLCRCHPAWGSVLCFWLKFTHLFILCVCLWFGWWFIPGWCLQAGWNFDFSFKKKEKTNKHFFVL